MSRRSKITHSPPIAVENALKQLGRNIRMARLRRRLRMQDVADRIGTSRFTIADLERGKPSTSVAAYLGSLWALGLLDQMESVADPDLDEEGKMLENARPPGRAPLSRQRGKKSRT